MSSKASIEILAEEIRSDAVHEGVDISTILRKCKVLAAEVGNRELDLWSTWEALGYPTDQPVPHYRLIPLQLTGRFIGPFGLVKTASVPLSYLPDYSRNFRDAYECREGAALIEQSLLGAENGVAAISTGELHKSVGRSLVRGYRCTFVRAEASSAKLGLAMHAIRNHILNVTNAILQLQRDCIWATKESAVHPTCEVANLGLVLRRERTFTLQEKVALQKSWTSVRYTHRSAK